MHLSANITRSLAQDLKMKVTKAKSRGAEEEKEQEKEESRKNLEKQNLSVFIKRNTKQGKRNIVKEKENIKQKEGNYFL